MIYHVTQRVDGVDLEPKIYHEYSDASAMEHAIRRCTFPDGACWMLTVVSEDGRFFAKLRGEGSAKDYR